MVLLTVAFFTLFERKVIGLIHLRVGPNKVSFLGVLQPLYDAFKLLTKQSLVSVRSNKLVFSFAPQASLFLSLSFWLLIPSFSAVFSNSFSLLAFIFVGSVMVFCNLLAGWSRNSKYTFVGSLRSVAQSVSYESVLTTLVIFLVVLTFSYRVLSVSSISSLVLLFILPLWVFSTLAETHRAPFDFSESESELVSGYNTEYSGALFAYVFLAEYSSLLFSCGLIYYLFFFIGRLNPLFFSLSVLSIRFFFIVVRVTFCRFRYDLLMSLAWKSLLPISLVFLLAVYYLVSRGS